MTSPIRPNEVFDIKKGQLPDVVLESFNELIVQKFTGGMATVKQADVVAMIVGKGYERQRIFYDHWLDVEDIYRAAGWDVKYDRLGYNESGEAYFEFTAPKGK